MTRDAITMTIRVLSAIRACPLGGVRGLEQCGRLCPTKVNAAFRSDPF